VGDKISIAEARARRTDPVWRRRHKLADLAGAGFVVLLVVLPPLTAAVWRPVGAAADVALLVLAPAALWLRGPIGGFERRAAFLVVIPGLNLVVLVPAVWRAAHLHLQHWQGPLEPGWDDTVWRVVGSLAVVVWLAGAAAAVAWTLG